MDLPVLPPHPGLHLGDVEALAAYLRERGVDYVRQDFGVTIAVDLGEAFDFAIDVHWIDDQVRFVAPAGLHVQETKLGEVALAIERLNWELGFPVWRVVPTLAATYTVTLDHTGSLSSRELEYAMALLRLALERDRPRLRETPGVGSP
jgi:hypothetical protein